LLNSIDGESDFTVFAGSFGSATGTPNTMSNNVGNWYRLQLRRTSLASYRCELFTDSGTQLFAIDKTVGGLPARAYVFIGLGPTARFDWVSVPEPTTVATLACGAAAQLRQRRKKLPN
jgi:hypothetical protein